MKPDRINPSPVLLLVIVLAIVAASAYPALYVAAQGSLQPELLQADQAHITDGIIAMGIVLVIIVIGGVLWGSRGKGRTRPPKKKNE